MKEGVTVHRSANFKLTTGLLGVELDHDHPAMQIGGPAATNYLMNLRLEEIERRILSLEAASCDTHPKDGDVQQAPLVSGAAAKPRRPNTGSHSQN